MAAAAAVGGVPGGPLSLVDVKLPVKHVLSKELQAGGGATRAHAQACRQ